MHGVLRLLAVVFGFFTTLISLAVAVQLWQWFAVTPYGLPAISIPIVWGLLLGYKLVTTDFAALLIQVFTTDEEVATKASLVAIPLRIVFSIVAYGIGWILTHFM